MKTEPDGYLDVTIRLRIPVRLEHYPEDVDTVAAALEYEQASFEEGAYGEDDLISTSESVEVTWEVAT